MTAEEFDQLPHEEGRRLELLNGEVVELSTPTYEHNEIVMRLGESVRAVLLPAGGGAVFNISFSIGNQRPQPDLAILLPEKQARVNLRRLPVTEVPDVAVEVVSPSETAIDLYSKT